MAFNITLRDKSAERLAEHDRTLDAEDRTQPDDVVGKGVQRPFVGGASIAAAVTAMVVIDDLRDVGEARERRLETRVVVTRSAVQQHQRRLGEQRRAVGHVAGALDVDEQPHAGFDLDAHQAMVLAVAGAASPGRSRPKPIAAARPENSAPHANAT